MVSSVKCSLVTLHMVVFASAELSRSSSDFCDQSQEWHDRQHISEEQAMTNVEFDSPRFDAGMTSDLFKLIDVASPTGENKKGLFASFKKTAVKLSRRSVGKEFEHQALDGPSFSADSEQGKIGGNIGEDDGWAFESRDDWGGNEEINISTSHREGLERDQTGFPPLAPSKATKFRSPPNKKKFNPKLQFSSSKKKLEKRKPKDFSLTQMISQSFDSESGSVSGRTRKYLDYESPDTFEVSQHQTSSTEYAQFDFSGGAPRIIHHDAALDMYPSNDSSDDEESTQNEATINGNLSEQKDTRLSQPVAVSDTDASCTKKSRTTGDEAIMSFKDRLAIYNKQSPGVMQNPESIKPTVLQGPLSYQQNNVDPEQIIASKDKIKCGIQPEASVSPSLPKKITAADETIEDDNDSDKSANPFKVKLRPIRHSADGTKSVQPNVVKVPVARSEASADRPVKAPTAKRLSIAGKPLSYIPMISCPGDTLLSPSPKPAPCEGRISSQKGLAPRISLVSKEAPYRESLDSKAFSKETNTDKPLSFDQRKAAFLSRASLDLQGPTMPKRDSPRSLNAGTAPQGGTWANSGSNTSNDSRESICEDRVAFMQSHASEHPLTLRFNGKTQPSVIDLPKQEKPTLGMKSFHPLNATSEFDADEAKTKANGRSSSPVGMTLADRKRALLCEYQGSGKNEASISESRECASTLEGSTKIERSGTSGRAANCITGQIVEISSKPKTFRGNKRDEQIVKAQTESAASASAREIAATVEKWSKKTQHEKGITGSAREKSDSRIPLENKKNLVSTKNLSSEATKPPNYAQVRASLLSIKRSPSPDEDFRKAEIQNTKNPIVRPPKIASELCAAEPSVTLAMRNTHIEQIQSKPECLKVTDEPVSIADRKKALNSKLPSLSQVSVSTQPREFKSLRDFSNKQDSTSGSKATVKPGSAERSDYFAQSRSFFNSKLTRATEVEVDVECKSKGDVPSTTSTKITQPKREGCRSVDDGHPLYVTVDAAYSVDECLSPSPTSMEREVVCEPTRGESYFEGRHEQESEACQVTEGEPYCQATTTEKYHAVKTRFSQKALPWRQKNAADRYLERNKLSSPDSVNTTHKSAPFFPISN